MDLNPAFPVGRRGPIDCFLWGKRNLNIEQPLLDLYRLGLQAILEAKVPAWVLWCTVFGTDHLIAVVDNEISAVQCSERHVAVCGDEHRPHMHLSALSETLLLRLDAGDGLDFDANIYRVSPQQVLENTYRELVSENGGVGALTNTH